MFEVGTRVRVKALNTIISEYWNVTGVVTFDTEVSICGSVKEFPIPIIFDADPFIGWFDSPIRYFKEDELEVISGEE